MMIGVYGVNPQLRQQAQDVRAARLEAKRAELAQRLEALKGDQR